LCFFLNTILHLQNNTMIEIIEYEDAYAAAFKALNLEWLDRYALTEAQDLLYLNNPREQILDKGGAIYLAKAADEIVGTAALIDEGHGMYELAKMSVMAAFQGRGISKLLLEKCIDKAKTLQAKKIILFSNSQLKAALALYQKYGFVHLPPGDTPYETADIKMELVL
jgi:putative acetyltransferase